MDINTLKHELSMGLQEALNKELLAGENLILSLPGSFGEAVAVSDRRAFVLRDCESGLNANCSVFNYPLASVKGARVVSSQTGGYLELTLSEAAPDPDQARVYFPSYDISLFQSAAEGINQLMTAKTEGVAPVQVASNAGSQARVNARACPKCGAGVDERAAFCGTCAEQLRQICGECSSASPLNSTYCIACGRKASGFTPTCAKCGARVLRWMTYCTECGSIQSKSCLACGATIQDFWSHCGNCGRLLGSDKLDPSRVHAVQRRLQEIKDKEESQVPRAQTQAVEQAAAPTANTAEDYNKQGQELFENGDLEGAIKAFKAAVQLESNNASYHCNLAVAYDENEQNELAFEEYTKTLEIDPTDTTALLSLGYMYSENEEPDKAQIIWNKVIQIAPDSAEAEEARGNLRHQQHL